MTGRQVIDQPRGDGGGGAAAVLCVSERKSAKLTRCRLPRIVFPWLVVTLQVTNHDIKKAIAQHKDSRSKDKSTIMTCMLRRLSQGHRSRAVADHTIWGYDADSFELALFDQPGAKPSKALGE